MKKLSNYFVPHGRYILAAIAGLLLTCGFPNIGVAGLAWLAPGLMLTAALGTRGIEAFRIGFAAGLAHYLSLLYWLLLIPYRWYGLPLGPAAGWLALSAYTAFFPATWVWVLSGFARTFRSEQAAEAEERFSFMGTASELPSTWARRALWIVCGAASWVALEMVRVRLFGGFPWSPLGASQYHLLPLVQIASFTGVYGISFVVVWVSLALVCAGLMMVQRPGARSVWVAEMCVPVLITAALFNLGFRQLRPGSQTTADRKIRVTLIQPSIPQTLIWDPSQDTNRFQELVDYTSHVLTNESDLVVWPESAMPKMLRYDTNTFNAITNLAQKYKVWLIVGSDDAEPSRTRSGNQDVPDYFNSSFLINPRGELVERYIKRNLVIFGEYVPLRRWLPFMQWFTPIEGGGFTAGTEPVEFRLKELGVKTSVLICFEDIFPQLGRLDVKAGSDFLVNITNDGWFGESAAQWQQATAALFRAVENRVPLIRCCNNGVSCWIDAQGRIRDILRDSKASVYGRGYLRVEIPLPSRNGYRQLTFYTQHGDVFGWVCAGIGGVCLCWTLLRNRRRERKVA